MHDGGVLGISYPEFKGLPTLLLTPWTGTEGMSHTGRSSTSATLICTKGAVKCDVLIIGEAP
ncbi:hypothetical protein HS141_16645 [Cetobacterium somerae]|uniref:hypothetical protein n=1 Tax=Cetobacterium somerae TaxID=188913 RepID=UPI00211DD643|nr:hypothetical protein [Cetobacterium somerae]MCQ9628296.1 hypothetical protein [Cetobacterium somerae]MCQ9628505.1 hypothetical protein [Cetobacterium somerae]MCQ9628536.1 hypothetical protein [Cetobacterium somerae]MCQ9628537.1 hypothetical protein [Cetobacterium somerae]MCQ9628538.1 hypothetical protein [Cetobacterium somerae]